MLRLSRACLVVLAALAISACSGTAATNVPASQSAAASQPAASAAAACVKAGTGDAGATVEIKDFKFTPDPVTAKVGDIVAWTNQDTTQHTASLVDGTCGTDQLGTGMTGALVFNVAGTYPYQCNIHPSRMKGTITITQ